MFCAWFDRERDCFQFVGQHDGLKWIIPDRVTGRNIKESGTFLYETPDRKPLFFKTTTTKFIQQNGGSVEKRTSTKFFKARIIGMTKENRYDNKFVRTIEANRDIPLAILREGSDMSIAYIKEPENRFTLIYVRSKEEKKAIIEALENQGISCIKKKSRGLIKVLTKDSEEEREVKATALDVFLASSFLSEKNKIGGNAIEVEIGKED